MTAGYLVFLVIGRLLVFFAMKFIKDNEVKNKFINRLFSCSLCTGWWVYTILSAVTGYFIFEDWSPYIPVLAELATGGFSAALVYYVEMGYKSLHETIVI